MEIHEKTDREKHGKILGIDSSGLVAGIAVTEGETLLAEYDINYKKTHSQTLLPMMDEVRNMLGLDLYTIDAIAVASGPGSFTGLRIGSATAKGLGLALVKPLVEVPTLEGLAYNLWGSKDFICPIIDARRNQVYTGIYCFEEGRLVTCRPQMAADIRELIEQLGEMALKSGKSVIFLGDGVPVYRDIIMENIHVPCFFAPASCNRQRAGSIAALGSVYYAEGRFVAARDHQPEYLRQSQAEREREEKKKD